VEAKPFRVSRSGSSSASSSGGPAASGRSSSADSSSSVAVSDDTALALERAQLLRALERTQGNKAEAARLLGMPRSTYFSKLKKHRIE
jgi:transcriptional regulator of acetoin/glycerol metabolism